MAKEVICWPISSVKFPYPIHNLWQLFSGPPQVSSTTSSVCLLLQWIRQRQRTLQTWMEPRWSAPSQQISPGSLPIITVLVRNWKTRLTFRLRLLESSCEEIVDGDETVNTDALTWARKNEQDHLHRDLVFLCLPLNSLLKKKKNDLSEPFIASYQCVQIGVIWKWIMLKAFL